MRPRSMRASTLLDTPARPREEPRSPPGAGRRFLVGAVLAPALASLCVLLLGWLLVRAEEPAWQVVALAGGLSPLLLAGLYRPLGAGSLGLGAFVAPLAAASGGVAVSAWSVAAGAFLCYTVRYRLMRPTPADRGDSRDRRGVLRRASDALGLAGAAWLAVLPMGAGALGLAESWWRGPLSVALFAGGARLVERLPALGRNPPGGDPPWPREVLGALWDGLGWALGLATVSLLAVGWPSVAPLVIAFASLGAVAGVLAARREELGRSVRELQRLVSLGTTRVTPLRGGIAATIQREIGAVLEYQWLELRLDQVLGLPPVLSAGRGKELEERPLRPGPHPRAVPGVHRQRSWLVLERKLLSQERTFGTVKLWCDPREVATDDLELLDHLMGQLGGQAERVWLERVAAEDPLTKLVRRGVLEQRLREELARTRDEGEGAPLALVVLDLDRFKSINDRYGHLAGDRALSQVATVLLSQLGGTGLTCCRWGGEEFAVLMPGATGEDGLALAERLRRAVAETALSVDGGTIAPTISAGVAAVPELVRLDEEDLFELADRALFQAKAAGRNRCLMALDWNRFRGVDGVVYGERTGPQATPRL